MDNTTKQIGTLKKQNEGMENAFKNKGIEFNKLSIDEDTELEKELALLKDYNEYLKTISKNNKPPPQEKPKVEVAPISSVKKEEKQKKENDDNDEDDVVKEVKPVFTTITNMEDIKRSFFSREYETFHKIVREHPFRYYKVNYK
jgi:hypothetical protein